MTAIDWATKPAPWCWIGPQLRRECEEIVAQPLSVRSRRMALGITQQELAEAAGYASNSQVGYIESGVVMSGPEKRICETLDRLEAERDAQ